MNSAEDIYRAALSADVLLYLKDGQLAYKAPSGGIPGALRQRILEHKSDIVAFLHAEHAQQATQAGALPPLVRAADRSGLPVSRAQQRVWFAQEQTGDGSQFNIQGCFTFEGALDTSCFARAIAGLLRRHEVLRTTYVERAGRIVRTVQPAGAVPLHPIDLSGRDAQAQSAEVRAIIASDLHERFDLSRDPLLRVKLVHLSEQRHVAVFCMHHIASDGWSVGLLIEELCTRYAALVAGDAADGAENADPTADVLQYADFAAWQDAYLQGDALDAGLSYWSSALENIPQVHSLPIDKQRPARQTSRGELHRSLIETALVDGIRAYCHSRKATLFMFLETAFAVLLSQYGNHHDVVVGTPVAGRPLPDTESAVGLFLNTVALRCRVDPTQSFDAVLDANKAHILSAFAHQHVPFELVAERLQHRRSHSYSQVFQIWFVLQNNREVRFTLPGCAVSEYADLPPPAAKYELNLYAREVSGQIELDWVYNADVFDGRSIAHVAREFEKLLQCVIDAPHKACNGHGLFAAAYPEALPPAPAVRALTRNQEGLLSRVLAHATQNGDRAAVTTDQAECTYEQLDRLSDRHALAIRGTRTRERVGLLMGRGVDIVAAMLAALKLGRTYVPLDAGYPEARLRYMIAHARCDLIVCDAASRAVADRLAGDATVIDVSALDASVPVAQTADANVEEIALDRGAEQARSPAYILYTSGSTGLPKGVFQSRAGLAYHAGTYADALELSVDDKVLQLASFNFDASVLDTHGALLAGACVHLADIKATGKDALLRLIRERGVTVYHSTPTVFKYLFGDATGPAPSQIRCVVLGGEPVDPLTMQTFRRVFGSECRLLGLYGATESSLTTLGEIGVEQIDAGLHPGLGRPVPGMQVQVRRADGTPARVFETGQIVIRSAHLAEGYWEAPELTAEKFRTVDGGEREYATGDAGYLTPDGDIRFVGRLDFQVKLNGIRIELGEIENILQQHDDVAQAAALIHEDDGGADAALVACVAGPSIAGERDSGAQAEYERRLVAGLRAHLARWLPDYMVPGRFVFMERLPQTPSGKVDRRQLLGMIGPATQAVRTAPRDALEQRLADLWREVLNLDAVGIHDDFFQLGGHSLKAMRLLAAIEQACGVAIPMKDFFDRPDIEGCAERVRNGRGPDAVQSALPRAEADPDARHAPFPLTLIQQAYWLGRSDIFELGSVATQSYAEATVPDLSLDRLTRAFNRLIARHEMLRAVILPTGEQKILERVPDYAFAVIDLRAKSPAEIATATDTLRDEMASRVLPIDTWPVFDLRVSLLPDGSGRLHALTDAITLDAKSRSILARELSALYADIDRPLPPLTLSFRDYVLAAQRIVGTPAYATARAYWLERIDRLPAAPDLPMAPAPAQQAAGSVRRWDMTLDRGAWASLRAKAAQHRLTPANVLLTAFAETLALWSKSGRFCLNLTLFNRHRLHDQVDEIAGVFTSSIPLEVDLDAHGSFAQRAARIRDQLWKDMEHRHFSGIEVLRELNSRRGTALGAQLPVVFTSTVGLSEGSEPDDGAFAPDLSAGASRSRTSQVFLDCQLAERGDGATIVWNGIEALFPPGMLDDMFGVFRARVREILDCRDLDLPLTQTELPPSHRVRRDAVNATATPRAEGDLLHALFARRVATHADKVAVAWREGTLTYAQLDRLSTALAHRLRAAGVVVDQLVAVVAEKGWEQVVSVLAVLKAGGAYLPIDPDIPEQRRHQLLTQAEVAVALTQAHLQARLTWPAHVRCFGVVREELADTEHAPLPHVQTPTNLAYVIFTSGSTGTPKGVAIDHRGAVNTIEDINRRFAVTDRDAVLALSALNFDLSVYDIFGMLAAGGTIVYPAPALERDPLEWTRLAETHGVTLWNTVPALAQMWMDSLDERPTRSAPIRVLMMSGDWIPTGLPARIRRHFPDALQYSLGGATEASIWSIYYPIADVDPAWSSIPYGRPMENQSFHVKKADFRDCPDWVPGDLYIGGIGLAKGYWKDAAKTDAAFVICPLTGERLYKTGDLGRYLPDGDIEFLGREDNQVKINGYRIELGEIESAMAKHPMVKLAIAAAVGERNRRQLVAYVMLEEAVRKQLINDRAAIEALSAEVQQSVRQELPAYMMPAAFVLIDEVPLTVNGKVDRKALPVPEVQREPGTAHVPPGNEVEAALCEIWQQQLRVERVGIEDNFFELGGDSLLASRTVGAIRTRFGLGDQFRIRSFFEAPTVRATAANVSACLEVRAIEDRLRDLSTTAEEVEDGMI